VTDIFCFSKAAPDQYQSNSLKYSFHPNFTDKHWCCGTPTLSYGRNLVYCLSWLQVTGGLPQYPQVNSLDSTLKEATVEKFSYLKFVIMCQSYEVGF